MSNNMQNLKIYDIIDQLEDLIENSPKPKLSGSATKRTVDVEEVFDLLGDLKTTIPEDIRRANSLMIEAQNTIDSANDTAQETIDAANTKADAIVAEAQNKANLVLEKAREEYERLIAEDEIYQEAQKRAQLLAAKAEYNANEVFENAKTYADDILADLERFLDEYKNLVNVNRRDLGARARVATPVQPIQQFTQPSKPAMSADDVMASVQQQTAASAAAAAQPARKPVFPQPKPEPRNSVSESNRGRRKAAEPVDNIDDEDDDDYYDDDEEEDDKKGGFLFGLFKKHKNFDDDDFDDEDDDDFDD